MRKALLPPVTLVGACSATNAAAPSYGNAPDGLAAPAEASNLTLTWTSRRRRGLQKVNHVVVVLLDHQPFANYADGTPGRAAHWKGHARARDRDLAGGPGPSPVSHESQLFATTSCTFASATGYVLRLHVGETWLHRGRAAQAAPVTPNRHTEKWGTDRGMKPGSSPPPWTGGLGPRGSRESDYARSAR
jgi:hypothetical protein